MSSSYFQCVAYTDVESTVRVEDNVIYVKFDAEYTSVHLTFNPAQALNLTKELQFALSNMSIADITSEEKKFRRYDS